MIKCKICNKEYKRINIFHLKTHNILNETEYLSLYPKAKLYDSDYIKNISKFTKNGMNNDIVKSKLKYTKTKEHLDKMAKSISNLHKNGKYDNVYTIERNDKIANLKKEYWKINDTNIIQTWLKDWIGSEKHIEMCKSNQLKASRKIRGRKISKPEKAFALELKNKNINYKQQYELGGYVFDFYIPNENLLIEIDGSFYHPLKEEDCIYDMQKHNFNRDIKKTKVALELGFKLERIRV
jgi:very-short-patch-repair endonuclease